MPSKRLSRIAAAFLLLTSGCLRLGGLNYSPYHYPGQDPNLQTAIPDWQIRTDVTLVGLSAERMRVFGCDVTLEKVLRRAKELPEVIRPKLYAGAWISGDLAENQRQLQCLKRVCAEGLCDVAVVGTEVLLRQDVSEATLIGYVEEVQDALPSIPVTSADTYNMLLEHPDLMETVDLLMANIYPFWEGVAVERAVQFVHDRYRIMQDAAGGKELIVAETGWPSCGSALGDAIPSPENAAYFLTRIVTWSRVVKATMFYFEAFDEPWKAKSEGDVGPCWGIMEEDYYVKPDVKRVLKEMYPGPVSWEDSQIPGGPGEPEISFTFVPPSGSGENLRGRVLHVPVKEYAVVVYIRVWGTWWVKPYANNAFTDINSDGSFSTDVITGGSDHLATEFAAFLVPRNYVPPIALDWRELPQSLYEEAEAFVQVQR